MALLVAGANAVWSGASTWKTCDGVLRSDTQQSGISITEVFTQQFSLSAIDYDGIVLFPCSRTTSPSGTVRVRLYKGGVFVTGCETTINVADLPNVSTTVYPDMGPVFFAWPAPVTMVAGSDYTIGVVSSVSGTGINFYRDSTTNNFSRGVRRAGFSAAAAGDDFIIVGEKTAAGAMTPRTVTYDVTATTDWGSGSTTLLSITPAIAVGGGGTLQSQLNAATNYYMKVSGRFYIHFDGRFDIGTQGTPLPSNSSFTLEFDCVANTDFGLVTWSNYTLNMCHVKGFDVDGTTGDSNAWCRLTSNLASGAGTGAGSIVVEDTTGWAVGDEFELSVSRHANTSLISTVAAIASGTSFSAAANTVNLHDGSATPQTPRAAVANLTRGIKIIGKSATQQGWIALWYSTQIPAPTSASVYMRGVEFKWMGSSNTGRRGLQLQSIGGTFVFDECVFKNFEVTSSVVDFQNRNAAVDLTVKNCIFNRINSGTTVTNVSVVSEIPNNRLLFQNCLAHRASAAGFTVSHVRTEFRRCMSISHAGSQCFSSSIGTAMPVTIFIADCDFGIGASNGGVILGGCLGSQATLERNYIWRCAGGNANAAHLVLQIDETFGQTVLTDWVIEGNPMRGITFGRGDICFKNLTLKGDSALGNMVVCITTGNSVNSSGGAPGGRLTFEGGSITAATQIIQPQGFSNVEMTMIDVACSIAMTSSSFLNQLSNLASGFIQVLKHNNVSNSNGVWVPNGRSVGPTFVYDTTIFATASPSLAIYPGSASAKVKSPTYSVAVAAGNAATPSIKVRESVVGDGADYNGNRARLIVKRNALAGITTDTVLATASASSEGAFETLSGTTATVTEDCILEFYVDCDGTTGWLNVDDFSCDSEDTRGMQFYSENKLSPWVVGGTVSGGGGGGGGGLRHPLGRF